MHAHPRIVVVASAAERSPLQPWLVAAGHAPVCHARLAQAFAGDAPQPDAVVVDERLLQPDDADRVVECARQHHHCTWVFTGLEPGAAFAALVRDGRGGVEFLREGFAGAEAEALVARIAARARERAERDALRHDMGRFCQRLSHDLQGVFQNIEGYAEALHVAAGARLEERHARWLERIRAGSQRGNGVLLDLASLAGVLAAPLNAEPVGANALVDRCLSELQAAAAGRAVEWQVEALPTLAVDAPLAQLALRQLLANALKFTRGREPARIEVSAARDGERWEIRVRDNGVGFDPDYGERLFSPFERLHPPGAYEGRGIGLALVKAVAERHGGTVRADGRPEQGATFAVSWPAAEAMPPVPAPVPSAGREPLRVLLVDDDALVVGTLRNMLERDGHAVASADGGRAGIEAARSAQPPFDLVICDWAMPDLDGGQVAAALGALQPAPRVLLLTGRRPEMAQETPPGVALVLAKPVRAADLRDAVASCARA